MQSHSTRRILQRLLANSSYECPALRRQRVVTRCLRGPEYSRLPASQRRTLFSFVKETRPQPKGPRYDPGFPILVDVAAKARVHERPPPSGQIASAWRAFFRFRYETKFPLEDVQVNLTRRSFLHLQKTCKDLPDFGLPSEDLRMALMALRNMPGGDQIKGHNGLAKLIFGELQKRRSVSSRFGESSSSFKKELLPYLLILCRTGEPALARDTLEKYVASSQFPTSNQEPWRKIIQGFERKGDPEEMERTVAIMKKYNVEFDAKARVILVRYFSRIDDTENTKKWYEYPIEGAKPEALALTDWLVLQHCVRTDNIAWGDSIVRSILENNPSKEGWDTIFRWSALRGKGVDEIERMINIMVKRNADRACHISPDISTINFLIRIANDADDPYMAERFLSLAYKLGLKPDAQTHLLQLTYRLKVKDLEGARAAYAALQAFDVPIETMNPRTEDLLQALISSPIYSSKPGPIFALLEDLLDRRARLSAPTISSLLKLYISRGELQEVVSILREHSFHFSIADRTALRQILVDFIEGSKATTTQAWDGYQILRSHFPETTIEVRTQLMQHFFAVRKRSDMGTHIFGHMRQASTPETRPTAETYRICFTHIAGFGDHENLQIVHNMLKLDSFIEPDTRVYNSLMLAYNACDENKYALGFWDDIAHSREGPTYNSIRIALHVCELSPWGDRYAKDIWRRLKKFGIDAHAHGLIAPYLKALTSQGLLDDAKELVDKEQAAGNEVKPEWLGAMYNGVSMQNEKAENVRTWARTQYPTAWEDLERGGQEEVKLYRKEYTLAVKALAEGLDP